MEIVVPLVEQASKSGQMQLEGERKEIAPTTRPVQVTKKTHFTNKMLGMLLCIHTMHVNIYNIY